MESERVLEVLDCTLTGQEILYRSETLARRLHEHDQVDADRKSRAAGDRAALKGLEAEIGRLAKQVRLGVEEREVECDWEPADGGLVNLIRRDTGEVVRWRLMTERERQRELFRSGKPGSEALDEDSGLG